VRIPKLTRLACLAALVGAAAPSLSSQQSEFGPYKFDMKIRLGFYGGDLQQTKFDNKIMGFGFQARREMFGPGSAIAAEFTWEHIPSRWHDITDYNKHNQYNTEQDWTDKNLLSLHPFWSFDARKESSRGLSALVSYHQKMPSGTGIDVIDRALDGMEWYAGLRLDRYNVYSEFRWRLCDQSNQAPILPPPAGAPTTKPPTYNGNGAKKGGEGAFHEEGGNLTPGAFAGIRYSLNENFALECDLRYFGTKHWDMTPGVYFKTETGGHDTQYRIKTGTSYGMGIGFALVCKL